MSKTFRFYRNPWHRLLGWLSGGALGHGQVFSALNNVSFQVTRGSAVGLVGENGAGKSTLLKIICGTLYPTAGRITLNGRIASLLELGTGFHMDFTGRQNIVFNARFLGLNNAEISQRMHAIIAFSELDAFIDRPLRTYSSGMVLRLAFAVMANVDPQLLIIDEALSVGDAYFQQKCMQRIRQFRDEGVTLLFVSHDPGIVKTLCNQALLLHQGQIVDTGRPEEVLANYNTLIARQSGNRDILSLEVARAAAVDRPDTPAIQRAGSFEALVEQVELTDGQGHTSRTFEAGEQAWINVRARCIEAVTEPTIGILIRDRLGNDVYGTNTYHQQLSVGVCQTGQIVEARFHLVLNLGPGEYSLTVAVHTLDVHIHQSFDWIDRLLIFKVLPALNGKFIGTAFLQPQVSFQHVIDQNEHEARDSWERALVGAFGSHFPQSITVTGETKPWLLTGWQPSEGDAETAFCWTAEHCSCLLDLRGQQLLVEVGANLGMDSQMDSRGSIQIGVWVFMQALGWLTVDTTVEWGVYSLPIPAACQLAHGLVRMQVHGSCLPAQAGHTEQHLAGVRVRRIWVTQKPTQTERG